MSSGWSAMYRQERGLTTLIERVVSPRMSSPVVTRTVTSPARSSSTAHICRRVELHRRSERHDLSGDNRELRLPRAAQRHSPVGQHDRHGNGFKIIRQPASLTLFTNAMELCAIAKLTNSHIRTSMRT